MVQVAIDPLAAAAQIRRGVTGLASRARVERAGSLSMNQTAVLGLLAKAGEMTPGELARLMRVRPQSLTRTFASLQAEGRVRRAPDPIDGRQYLLTITSSGRQALRDEMQPRDEWLARAVAAELTDAERDLLVVAARLMERLALAGLSPARTEP